MLKKLTSAMALSLLVGCATTQAPQAMLTYETKPEGATLFEGGVAIGSEPVSRIYRVPEGAATVRTPEVTAIWPSGAKAVFWTELKKGADELAVINRPAASPGLEKDIALAASVLEARRKGEQRTAEQLRSDIARQSSRCLQELASGKGAAVSACR